MVGIKSDKPGLALNHVELDNLRHKTGCLSKTFCFNIERKSSTVPFTSIYVSFRLFCRCLLIKSNPLNITCIDLTLRDRAEQRRLPTAPQPESKFKSACAAGKRRASSVPDADVFRSQRGLRLQRTARHHGHENKGGVGAEGPGGRGFFYVYRRKRQLQVGLKCLLGRSWMRTPLSMIYINLAISREALGSHCSAPKKEERNRPVYKTIKTKRCHL